MTETLTKWVLGHKVTCYPTTGDYDLMMAETPPNMQGPPPHLHNRFKEVFLITEGEMEFFVNGVTKILKAGDSIDIPPNTVHTFKNISNQTCKWVNIHSPKGFVKFFETVGVDSHEKNALEKSVSDQRIQEVINTASDYDMILQIS